MNFLLHNYLHSHVALPTKISFLTASPNLSTYFLKLAGEDKAHLKQYNDIKNKIKNYLDANNVENSYEFPGENSIQYLLDGNASHEQAIQEIIGEASGISTEFREVFSIGDEEKSLLKRFSGIKV